MRWEREAGARISGDRPLDLGKVQAPGIVRCSMGDQEGWRLFYTAVGPDRPFDRCQGYILSAFSTDGLNFLASGSRHGQTSSMDPVGYSLQPWCPPYIQFLGTRASACLSSLVAKPTFQRS